MTASTEVRPAHAKYSASAAHRWSACAGSITMAQELRIKDTGSRYAAEGTLGHTLAAQCLTDGADPSTFVGTQHTVEGFDFTVDQAFVDHIRSYVDAVRQYAAGGAQLMVEQEVNYAEFLGVKPHEAFGTSDAIVLREDELHVIDLKMGQGEIVDAERNAQLMLYALGAVAQYGDLLGYDMDTKVTLVIHQPRVRKAPSEWSCTVSDLILFGNEMKLAAHQEKAALWGHTGYRNDGRKPEDFKAWADQYLVPGEKQCRWCAAKATCPKAREVVTQTVLNMTPATPEEFADLSIDLKPHVQASTNDWLSAAMKQVPLIKSWINAVIAEVDRRVLEGQQVDGFKAVMGDQGDRKWADEKAAEAAMVAMRLKRDVMYTSKLISPPQAEKLASGKTPKIGDRQWAKLQGMITRAPGAPCVVPAGHPKPAITIHPVDEEFEDLAAPGTDGGASLQSLADDIG